MRQTQPETTANIISAPIMTHQKPDSLTVGRLTVSRLRRTAQMGDREVSLTSAEFDLLWYLAQRAGSTVSRDELYRTLLESEYDGLDRCMDLRVCRLRKKLGDDPRRPQLIKSIRSEGYILVVDTD